MVCSLRRHLQHSLLSSWTHTFSIRDTASSCKSTLAGTSSFRNKSKASLLLLKALLFSHRLTLHSRNDLVTPDKRGFRTKHRAAAARGRSSRMFFKVLLLRTLTPPHQTNSSLYLNGFSSSLDPRTQPDMIPSVLLPAVHQDPSTPYLDSTPVASTSAVPYTPDEQTIHCSQCNRDLPRSNFPTRLINLQPYQVCRAHEWYWTEAKRAQNWAPEHTSTLQQICDAFEEVARDDGEFEDRFMVNGEERDVDRMVQALARAGNWKLKSM